MRRLPLLLACALLALALGATSASAFEVRATSADNGKTVHLNRGDRLQVTLSENAGTGYAWRLTRRPMAGVLRGLSNRHVAPASTNPPTAGTPGRRIVRWRAVGRGTTSLRLQLFPPGSSRAAQTYRLGVVVH